MYKICGDVEIVPRVIPAGEHGWAALRTAENHVDTGRPTMLPSCTFGSPREAMDAALLYGQRVLGDWVRGAA